MKRVVRVVTKTVQETVEVCDHCQQERDLPLGINYSSHCRYDACLDDYETYKYCSLACLRAGAPRDLNLTTYDTVEDTLTLRIHDDPEAQRWLQNVLTSSE